MTDIVETDLEVRSQPLLSRLTDNNYHIHYSASPRLTSVDRLKAVYANHLNTNSKLIFVTNNYFDTASFAFLQANNIEVWGNLSPQFVPTGLTYQQLPSLTDTIDSAALPYHEGQALLLNLPAGETTLEVYYLDRNASLELLDATGEHLDNEQSFFTSSSPEQTLAVMPVNVSLPTAQAIYVDVSTSGGWLLNTHPTDTPLTTISASGHGFALIPLTLQAANYQVHFKGTGNPDDSIEFDGHGNLYHYGSGPVDMTKIYHFDQAETQMVRINTAQDWQFSIQQLGRNEVQN